MLAPARGKDSTPCSPPRQSASIHTENTAPANGSTWDGVAAIHQPRCAECTYWTRVDYLLTQAASSNMTVFLNIAPGYTLNSGAAQFNWTVAQWQALGTAVGNRYKTAEPGVDDRRRLLR